MSDRTVRVILAALAESTQTIDPALARQIGRTPVNEGNGFACVLRGVVNFEVTTRARWALPRAAPLTRAQATVLEVAALLRLAVWSSTLNASDVEWLASLERRAAELVGRLKGASLAV